MLYFSKAENERVSRVGHEETIQKLDSCPRNRKAPRHACMLAAAQPSDACGSVSGHTLPPCFAITLFYLKCFKIVNIVH